MTNHVHVAGYFPEGYEGKLEINGKEMTIIEIATGRELPPILTRIGTWVVTPIGLENLIEEYSISKDSLDGQDWIRHMEEKMWVDIGEFKRALSTAKNMKKLEII